MISYPPECSGCPYRDIGQGFVPPDEPQNSTKIVFYGEAPGKDEVELGQGFVGKAGSMLRVCANRARVSMPFVRYAKEGGREIGPGDSEAVCANVLLCRPPFNRFPDDSVAYECMRRHEARHAKLRDFPIIAFGGNASRILSGGMSWSTKLEHGTLAPFGDSDGRDWFRVSMHPSFLVRGGGKDEESSEGGKGGQFQLAPLLSTVIATSLLPEAMTPRLPRFKFVEPAGFWPVIRNLEPRRVAVDIEGQAGQPVLVGLAWDPQTAWVLWWGEETRKILQWLFQTEHEFVFHNGSYDVSELALAGVMPPRTWIDTINTAALIDPSPVGFFGLQQQSLLYVPGSVAWKGLVNHDQLDDDGAKVEKARELWRLVFEQHGEWLPTCWQHWFGFYNALDVTNTLKLSWSHQEVLGRRWYYYQTFMQPLQRPLLEMGERGMPVDPVVLLRHREGCLRLEKMARGIIREAGCRFLEIKKEEFRQMIREMENEREREQKERAALMLHKGRGRYSRAEELSKLRTKAKRWLDAEELNLGSPPQRSEFLGEWLGLPLPRTKKGKYFSTKEQHLLDALEKVEVGGCKIKARVARADVVRILRACIAGSVWGTWRRNFLEGALRKCGVGVPEEAPVLPELDEEAE